MNTVPNMLEMVERFNRDLIGVSVPDRPTILDLRRHEFRLGHMREELAEIESAMSDGDLAGITDGILDLVYVALGMLIEMGIAPGATFEEVHLANMAKERGDVAARPGSLGHDAVKPPGWTPPDLEPYLTLARWEVTYLMEQREIADAYVPEEDEESVESPLPKILVIGHARHGKDTMCERLRDLYGFRFTSSSMFCAEHVVLPHFEGLRNRGHNVPAYETAEQCFEDRFRYREVWFNAISEYNRPDPSRLARAILEEHDVYCGMRWSTELHACRNAGLFDHIVWVDGSRREPPEGRESCTVEPWMADYVVDANGTLEDGELSLRQLMGRLLP